MKFTAQQICTQVQGVLEGNATVEVWNFSGLETAQNGDLAFLDNLKYEPFLYTTKATLVLVPQSLELKETIEASIIRVAEPRTAFSRLLRYYEMLQKPALEGISPLSSIASSAVLGEKVYVGAFSVIGANCNISDKVEIHPQTFIGDKVQIGENTVIHAGVRIYNGCIIGKNCILHAGTVIGSDGFGFNKLSDGTYEKMPQLGNVVIEDLVEIGANCTIDRATLGSTFIAEGCKLDNLIQVAHNVSIGKNTVIAAQTGIAGSTKIGANCIVGGQVGFAGHLEIADNTNFGAQAGVSKSIEEGGGTWSGSPARPLRENYRTLAQLKRLPELEKRINILEKKNNS
ncbi:MAG: UDP-3-O-(3-hydroxymyristoyl)glucosamine N-acyltransferase [Chitinophagales bacterium]|nr:UDP-3-O-(3-hydroxymyristoyl)glucosamine N-acyltransferase [Bacteroidota bacterium]MCB9043621.1 UDP-3-O-(3-hydroxymyristoyl)glucosamine N-acyltransferase [Chitinophagales bacterium]